VIGILGGSAGTTLDAFQLIHEAQKYGARVALFGRKINNSENQLAFVRFLRLIVDGVLDPIEAVRAYHSVLEKLNVTPRRSLADDLVLETGVMSYGGSETRTISLPSSESVSESLSDPSSEPVDDGEGLDDSPDFSAMTSDERLAYHRRRLANLLGP
jgi:hypothetical protein